MSCSLYQHALAQAIKAGRGACATSPHNYSIVHRQKASQHLFGVGTNSKGCSRSFLLFQTDAEGSMWHLHREGQPQLCLRHLSAKIRP